MSSKPKPPFPKGASDTYRRTQVVTANRETLLLMMYAGAIRFLKQAIDASEKNDLAERARLVGRTQQIVLELRATLNHEVGGEIAQHLESLYEFITQRLVQATIHKSIEPLNEALGILNTLNLAWEEAIEILNKSKSTSK